jgi:hypothetical protein
MKFPLAAALASDVEFLERWLAAGNDIDEPLEPEAADVARRPEVTGQLLAMLNAGGGAKLDPESLLFTHRKLSATLGIAFDESTARAALSDCDARSDGRIAVQQYSSLFSARVQDASPSLSWTALHLCAGRGNLDAVRTLLELGANPNKRCGSRRFAALHIAARYDHAGVAEMLLSRGAEIDAKDGQGYTALHAAVAQNSIAAARVLVSEGADMSVATRHGYSPLDIARHLNLGELTAFIESGGISGDASTAARLDPSGLAALRRWLALIGCAEYAARFEAAGFDDLAAINALGLSESDLVEVGVVKRGHRRKLMSLYRINEVFMAP